MSVRKINARDFNSTVNYAPRNKTLQQKLFYTILVGLVLLGGCQANSSIPESDSQNQTQNISAQVQTAKPVSMVFFGDVMLDRYVRRYMNKNGLDYPFEKMDKNYLEVPDLLIANLEGPIARQKTVTSKSIAFRFLPDIVPLLKKYSFDIFSLANNHAMDMGANGYSDTKDLLNEAGINFFGDPRGIKDGSVLRTEKNGQKFAFIGLEEVTYKIKDDEVIAKIKELVAAGYQVIVVPHWGIEYQHLPNKRQTELAHKFIDAGALMVVGGHPHVVQSYENYKGHAIFYSLGNAIFDQYFSNDTQEGLSLKIVVTPGAAGDSNGTGSADAVDAGSASDDAGGASGAGGAGGAAGAGSPSITIQLNPIRIDHSQMRLMTTEERSKFLERFATYGSHNDEEKAAILSGKLEL